MTGKQDARTAFSTLEDFEDDALSYADDLEGEDDESLRPGLYMLGLDKDYIPFWTCQDAFRELYQNWFVHISSRRLIDADFTRKDGIISSFHLDPRSFNPVINKFEDHIEVTIRANSNTINGNSTDELLGYIRFNKKAGTVELANFKAALGLKHLSLGVSEKRNQDRLAGTHGEGFKLAALVLCRHRHGVRFESTSYYWNLSLRGRNKSTLGCQLSQMKDERLQKLRTQYNKLKSRPKFERGLTSNIWEDVKVTISKARGENGIAVSEEDFKYWMQVTLELDPPASDKIIHTKQGDLILDPRFQGSIYLKGLRIAGHEIQYVHGYNFTHGKINRDRDRLANLSEEKATMSNIWGDAIMQNNLGVADTYIDLLRTQKSCAETLWTCHKITQPPVDIIWRRLRETNPNTFFYFEDESLSGILVNDQEEIIRFDFKSVAFPLSRELWELLRKFKLARTPEEEQNHRFQMSTVVPSDQNSFQLSVVQALKACLSLESSLSPLDICFVTGGGTNMDLMFDTDANIIKIHQKWLDFDEVHKETTCDILDLVNQGKVDKGACFCDRMVEDLFELVLGKISGPFEIPLLRQRILRGQTRSCLRLMPRSVLVSQGQTAGVLEVTWIGNENGVVCDNHSDQIRYLVILHKESTCKSKRNKLIGSATTQSDSTGSGTATLERKFLVECGCAAQFISRTFSKACFGGLDHRQRYFPMVARASTISFSGCPPQSIAPKPPSSGTVPRSRLTYSSGSPRTQISPSTSKSRARTERYQSIPVSSYSQSIDLTLPHIQEGFSDPAENTNFSEHDQTEWRNWFQNDLLRELARFTARRECRDTNAAHSVGSLECSHLNFCFEKDEYACVQLIDSGSAAFPILVHGIYSEDENFDQDRAYLLVTKYSLLQSTLSSLKLPSGTNKLTAETHREVMLHFQEHDKMGSREDAEIIKLNEIASATHLTASTGIVVTEIDHFSRPPHDLADSSIFCRFAIGKAQRETEICLTPVAPHLLSRQDRLKEVKYSTASKPVDYDFSPEILGPSEGLSQAGFGIEVCLGFEPSQHLTWKTRHHKSQVYDGSPKSILENLEKGQLHPPATSQAPVPKVAVVAGSNVPFRLNNRNAHLPPLEQFLEVLQKVEAATQSFLKSTFTVMLASPAILHHKARYPLNTTILRLLEQRLSIHMKICSLSDQGLPLQRDVLVLVASTLSSSVPWNLFWPMLPRPRPMMVETLIRDLAFENPRATNESNSGFVCLRPDSDTTDAQSTHHIHNHRTGQKTSQSLVPLRSSTDKLDALTALPQLWIHPSRHDRLTVRELARFQGFPDDFVFYHSEEDQYRDVWSAYPPVISRLVG